MISYNTFWNTLKSKNISIYYLTKKKNISNGTISRMRNKEYISTSTVDKFCKILNCSVTDVITYIPDEVENVEEKGIDYLLLDDSEKEKNRVESILEKLLNELNMNEKRLLIKFLREFDIYKKTIKN